MIIEFGDILCDFSTIANYFKSMFNAAMAVEKNLFLGPPKIRDMKHQQQHPVSIVWLCVRWDCVSEAYGEKNHLNRLLTYLYEALRIAINDDHVSGRV